MTHKHAIYPSLQDKVVLLTGGAQGIGAATVELFVRQGSKVLFLDLDEPAAQRTLNTITSIIHEAQSNPETKSHAATWKPPTFHQIDLTDLPALQSLTQRILSEVGGKVDILINNAAAPGSLARISTENITPATWDFNINVNLRHVFFLTQAVVPAMKSSGGGSIVNIGSITWKVPDGAVPVYGACKAAIMGLTRAQSREFGSYGIRVNSVMPGAIATQRQISEVLTDEYRAEVMRNQSLQRDLRPEEVARVVVFLASEEASGVTGSSYVVDGGWCSDP